MAEKNDDLRMTQADLQALVASAVAAAMAHATPQGDLAKAITDGMNQVREPIPEQKIHHAISAQNPCGDRDHPRPGFKCEMWYGVITDEKPGRPSTVRRIAQVLAEDCTAWEQIAWNLLTPIDEPVTMLDGMAMRVRVKADVHDVTGDLERLTLAIPYKHFQKGSQTINMVPGIIAIVREVYGVDLTPRTLPPEQLAVVMAKHRRKEYVAA